MPRGLRVCYKYNWTPMSMNCGNRFGLQAGPPISQHNLWQQSKGWRQWDELGVAGVRAQWWSPCKLCTGLPVRGGGVEFLEVYCKRLPFHSFCGCLQSTWFGPHALLLIVLPVCWKRILVGREA